MGESPSSSETLRKWVVEHKLRTVGNPSDLLVSFPRVRFLTCGRYVLIASFCRQKGCLWLSGIGSSIAYNWSQSNMKPSVKIIHARLHAQALTLAALAGAAVVEYYDQYQSKSGGPKAN